MDTYTIFFDFETGGVEARHPSIQLAAIAVRDADWAEVASFEAKLKFDETAADPEALKMNHYDAEVWKAEAIPQALAASKLARWSEPYRSVEMISKRTGNPYRVAKLAGHNALTFDLPRLRELYGGAFFPFHYFVKDTLQRVLWFYDEHPEMKRPESLKLTTLCAAFGIPTDGAHDALTDVRLSAALAKAVQTAQGASLLEAREFLSSLENDDGHIPSAIWEIRNRVLGGASGKVMANA